jgi:uncharacterized membrane protein
VSESRVRLSRQITWGSLLLLALLQLVESVLQQPPLLVWIMRVLPLLIFVPGMRKDNLRSYIWLCFVCLLYFMTLVLRLFAQPTNPVAILAMICVVSLFVASMLYVRWRAQELKKENPNAQGE